MKYSCGIIILNDENNILMCHSTGNAFFDIPKGMMDEGENYKDSAIRECFEETSLIIDPNNLIDLGEFKYNKEKNLYLFLYRVNKQNIDLEKLKCTSMFECPRTKKILPEADFYRWINKEDIIKYCAKNMGRVLDSILNKPKLKP